MAAPLRHTHGFLGAAWLIARKDVAHMLVRRETIMWVFIMPVVFFYFIGTVTAGLGNGGADGRRDRLALRGDANGGLLVDELIRRLEAQRFEIVRPSSNEAFSKFDRRLTIPAPPAPYDTFTAAALAGQQQTIVFERRGDDSTSDEAIRAGRAVYEVLADLAVLTLNGQPVAPASFQSLAAMPRSLTLTVKTAGRRVFAPTGFAQAVPGTMVMFTMLVLLTSGAITLVIERDQGLLRRLASAPIPAGAVVLGKWMARMALALVQIAFAMVVGRVLFKVDWGPSLPMVGAVLFGWAAFTASLAILLANLMRTQAQMAGVGVFTTQVLAALGGCWWPIEITPPWMQKLSYAMPTGWAMHALHKLVNFGDPPAAAVPHLLVMLAGALILGAVGARRFRYQ